MILQIVMTCIGSRPTITVGMEFLPHEAIVLKPMLTLTVKFLQLVSNSNLYFQGSQDREREREREGGLLRASGRYTKGGRPTVSC
jgi:hypothetical protein